MKHNIVIDIDLEEIIPSFLSNRQKDIEEIEKSLSENNFKEIESIGHKLSGSAGSYGFDDLGQIGKDIENACKEDNQTLVKSLYAKYKDYLENLNITYE
jgi:HPt (histidine-containing phosphotransfer) domain-containing protein